MLLCLCQRDNALKSVLSKPSATPAGGAVSLATARARHATDLVQQTATFVLVGIFLYMDSVLTLTAHRDSILMVSRGSTVKADLGWLKKKFYVIHCNPGKLQIYEQKDRMTYQVIAESQITLVTRYFSESRVEMIAFLLWVTLEVSTLSQKCGGIHRLAQGHFRKLILAAEPTSLNPAEGPLGSSASSIYLSSPFSFVSVSPALGYNTPLFLLSAIYG